jgi:hypothetical protein
MLRSFAYFLFFAAVALTLGKASVDPSVTAPMRDLFACTAPIAFVLGIIFAVVNFKLVYQPREDENPEV